MDLVGLSIIDILHHADVNKFRSNISRLVCTTYTILLQVQITHLILRPKFYEKTWNEDVIISAEAAAPADAPACPAAPAPPSRILQPPALPHWAASKHPAKTPRVRGESAVSTTVNIWSNIWSLSSSRRSFYVRVKEKPLSRGDRAQYQHMHLVGHSAKRADKSIFLGVMRPVRDRWSWSHF